MGRLPTKGMLESTLISNLWGSSASCSLSLSLFFPSFRWQIYNAYYVWDTMLGFGILRWDSDLLLKSLIVQQRRTDVKQPRGTHLAGPVNGASTEHEVAEGYRCKRDGDRGFTEKVVLEWGGVGGFTRWMTGAWSGGSGDGVDVGKTFQEIEQD